jgi:large subunit ribosomal protein L15
MSLIHKLPAVTAKGLRRVGRGYGSTKGGHTSGRGTKGQLSRNGGKLPIWFEGGQLQLTKRLPWQRGKGRLKSFGKYQEVNLKDVLDKGLKTVSPQTLLEAGLIAETKYPVRVIGLGEITTKMQFEGVATSAPVRERVEKAGGSVTV